MTKVRGTLGRFWKISENEIFEQCQSTEKCKRGDPSGFFDIHWVAKYQNKRRGNPLMESKKLQKKWHSAEKSPVEKHQEGILCFWGCGRRCFCFGRVSGVSSMFWTSVVQVDDVEQMNKKVDRSRWTDEKKLATVRVVHFLRKCRLKTIEVCALFLLLGFSRSFLQEKVRLTVGSFFPSHVSRRSIFLQFLKTLVAMCRNGAHLLSSESSHFTEGLFLVGAFSFREKSPTITVASFFFFFFVRPQSSSRMYHFLQKLISSLRPSSTNANLLQRVPLSFFPFFT